ncbi:MAG: metalloregulator ArsR/SmtB family transcription factor [Planctomycetota bacterium]|nr:metalloregulator ArsR/SmtB family transcription factor [Planctomycetota bacterium]
MASPALLQRTAELFQVLSDPSRLRIINALLIRETRVGELVILSGLSQPAISHHLQVLRQTRLVRYRRQGKEVFYALDDQHVGTLFHQGLLHASEALPL